MTGSRAFPPSAENGGWPVAATRRPARSGSSADGRIEVVKEGYLRSLADRDVVVVRDGQPEQARLRGWLQGDVAVQGARRDTYPSGMLRDMGGGRRVYVMWAGQLARQEDVARTLDDAPPDQIVTVDQQREYVEAWRAEPEKQ
jgi:hypothetical protein